MGDITQRRFPGVEDEVPAVSQGDNELHMAQLGVTPSGGGTCRLGQARHDIGVEPDFAGISRLEQICGNFADPGQSDELALQGEQTTNSLGVDLRLVRVGGVNFNSAVDDGFGLHQVPVQFRLELRDERVDLFAGGDDGGTSEEIQHFEDGGEVLEQRLLHFKFHVVRSARLQVRNAQVPELGTFSLLLRSVGGNKHVPLLVECSDEFFDRDGCRVDLEPVPIGQLRSGGVGNGRIAFGLVGGHGGSVGVHFGGQPFGSGRFSGPTSSVQEMAPSSERNGEISASKLNELSVFFNL